MLYLGREASGPGAELGSFRYQAHLWGRVLHPQHGLSGKCSWGLCPLWQRQQSLRDGPGTHLPDWRLGPSVLTQTLGTAFGRAMHWVTRGQCPRDCPAVTILGDSGWSHLASCICRERGTHALRSTPEEGQPMRSYPPQRGLC